MTQRKFPADGSEIIAYPSAGMSGLPDHNYAWFRRVSELLRIWGWTVLPPTEVVHAGAARWSAEGYVYEDYIRDDILNALAKCNTLVLGPGWVQSRGSRDEFNFAASIGLFIFYFDPNTMADPIRMDEWVQTPETT